MSDSRKLFIAGLSLLFCVSCVGGETLSLTTAEVNGDGHRDFVLENQYLRIVIAPAQGGRVLSLIHKTSGKDLTSGPAYKTGDHGLLAERLWGKGKQIRALETMSYAAKRIEEKDRVGVVLSATNPLPPATGIVVEKTIILRRNEAALQVAYKVFNPDGKPYFGRLWICNVLRPNGAKAPAIEYWFPQAIAGDRFYLWNQTPLDRKTRADAHGMFVPGGNGANLVVNRPSQNWAAVTDADGGGAALQTDYGPLGCFYSYQPPVGYSCTLDILQQPFLFKPINTIEGELTAGKPLTFTMRFVPFAGLKRVDGVVDGIVSSVVRGAAGKLTARFYADRTRTVKIAAAFRRLPGGKEKALPTKTLAMVAGAISEVTWNNALSSHGTDVITLALRENNAPLGEIERAVTFGKPSGIYIAKDMGPKDRIEQPKSTVEWSFTAKVQTPHVKWAKPYAGGKPRVLFICTDATARDVIEFSQRFEVDCTIAPTAWSHQHVLDNRHTGTAHHDRMLVCLKKDYDLIVISGIFWKQVFTSAMQKTILAKVAAGTGLLYLEPRGLTKEVSALFAKTLATPEWLFAGVPMSMLPVWKDLTRARILSLHGNGRIARMRYPLNWKGKPYTAISSLLPYHRVPMPGVTYWEGYHAMLGKLIYHLSGKDTAVRMEAMKVDGNTVNLTLRLSGDRAQKVGINMELDHRPSGTMTVASTEYLLQPGENRLRLTAPDARYAGPAMLSVRIVDEAGKALTWGSSLRETPASVTVNNIAFDKEYYEPGEEVRATILMTGMETGDFSLRVTIEDSYGRVIFSKSLNRTLMAGKQFTWALPLQLQPLGRLHTLKVQVKVKDKPVVLATGEFFFRQPKPPFAFLLWGGKQMENPVYGQAAYNQIEKLGYFDEMLYNVARDTKEVVEANLYRIAKSNFSPSIIYFALMIRNRAKLDRLERSPCLSDPKFISDLRAACRKWAKVARRYDPIYNVGDEMSLGSYDQPHDFCFGAATLTAFRAHLRKEYGTLAKLNQEWNTDFAAWEQVRPYTRKDAKDKGNFIPWFEHRAFMGDQWCETFARVREGLAKEDKKVMVGAEGFCSTSSYSGFDYWRYSKSCESSVAYDRDNQMEILRSFQPGAHRLGRWYGAYESTRDIPGYNAFVPWEILLRGGNYAAYWNLPGLLKSDLSYTKWAFLGHEGCLKLKRGIGTLFTGAQRENAGVAIYYSYASVHAATASGFTSSITINTFRSAQTDIAGILEDVGLSYDFVSDEQLVADHLQKNGYRVLVLPLTQSLGNIEREAIARFVCAGGAVIANTRIGTVNRHGRAMKFGVLGKVFGLRSRGGLLRKAGIIRLHDNNALQLPAGAIGLRAMEKLILARDAVALGEAPVQAQTKAVMVGNMSVRSKGGSANTQPAFILHGYGKGRALYLNCLWDYAALRKAGTGQALITLFRALFAKCGAKMPYAVQCADGKVLQGWSLHAYRDGKINYLGVIKDHRLYDQKPKSVVIRLPRVSYVHELRTGKRLGRIDTIRAVVAPLKPLIYSLLPYEVKGVRLKVNKEAYAAGDTVAIHLRLRADGKPGRHVCHLWLEAPDGSTPAAYRRNVVLYDGAATTTVPLALNDARGIWKIHAQDAASGVVGTTAFVVK